MRLDKFLKVSRLIKRRTVANEACDAGRVLVNDRPAKASAQVKAGDVLLPFIEKPFKDRAFFASQNVKFALATLGNDAGICGAAKMVLGD